MSDSNLLSETLFEKEKRSFIEYLVKKGGPDQQEYDSFTSVVNGLRQVDIADFRQILMPILNTNTLIGHGFTKPFGYPGDFTLINNIYSFYVNQDERYRNWDLFFQNQPGAIAVRNRKEYFLNHCKRLINQGNRNIKVLILGSGPATDVNEFLTNFPESKISFDLIDFDKNAIDFSMRKNVKFNGSISYNRINVLRYKPYKTYDLIWSAGLFDYFKDKHFIYLIQKYINCLSEEGEFVISNFSTDNPTRKLMEVLSDWYLNHRSKTELFNIALEAGLDDKMVKIETEPLGINLFLNINLI